MHANHSTEFDLTVDFDSFVLMKNAVFSTQQPRTPGEEVMNEQDLSKSPNCL